MVSKSSSSSCIGGHLKQHKYNVNSLFWFLISHDFDFKLFKNLAFFYSAIKFYLYFLFVSNNSLQQICALINLEFLLLFLYQYLLWDLLILFLRLFLSVLKWQYIIQQIQQCAGHQQINNYWFCLKNIRAHLLVCWRLLTVQDILREARQI